MSTPIGLTQDEEEEFDAIMIEIICANQSEGDQYVKFCPPTMIGHEASITDDGDLATVNFV